MANDPIEWAWLAEEEDQADVLNLDEQQAAEDELPFLGWLSPQQPAKIRRRPVIARDPTVSPRLRRFTGFLSEIINSLFAKGQIEQVGPADFEIRGGGFTNTRPPTVSDDSTQGATPGCSWVDSSGGTVYFCIDNTPGAAVWNGPY